MFGSAVCVVGLLLILSYVDNVTARSLFQSHDSVKLIGNERLDVSVHEVLGRHKREAPSMSYLRSITVRNDVHPHAISRHDRYNFSNYKTISGHFFALYVFVISKDVRYHFLTI